MALRIKIPFVLDLAIVRDDAEMTRLNNEPAVVRHVSGQGGLLHRLIRARVDSLPVRNGRLPALERQDDPLRQAAQREAEAALTRLAQEPHPFDRGAIARLARFVVGDDLAQPIGVTVQGLVGRMLEPGYTASPESYAAARDVAAVFSSCPVAALRVVWWRITGRLARSKALIWRLGRDNPILIHATAIAMHHVVDSLTRMRTAMKTDVWDTPPAQAAACALAAPPRLIRQCTAGLGGRNGLSDGTMIWFNLRAIHKDTENNDLAFSRNQWSQCPAHAIVPKLLEEVWATAVRERATQRSVRTPSLVRRVVVAPVLRAVTRFNRRWPWYRLGWWPLAFVNLALVRKVLRERNLHDTGLLPAAGVPAPPAPTLDVRRWRTADGSYNDLSDPNMGRAGTRFGRNVPLAYTYPDEANLLEPSPREVSRQLLTRNGRMIEQDGLNVLSAAWIQFQVHDWFSHATDMDPQHAIPIELQDGDPWPKAWRPMLVPRTLADRTRPDGGAAGPPTYLNKVTHWWDASQLYGSDQARQDAVRAHAGGRLRLVPSPDGPRLPRAEAGEAGFPPGIEKTGVTDNWWLGLSLFHQLFTLEHNAICERLQAEFLQWDDEQLFQTARLINAALITKIHDLEWVPIVLANKPVQKGLYVSWWGLLGKWVATRLGRLPNSEMLSGIPGSATDHHAAPYAITEEFVSVYRMHAFMMPDEFAIHDVASGEFRYPMPLRDVLGAGAFDAVTKFGFDNLFYSFGRTLPGKLTLGNYSSTLQQLVLQRPPAEAGEAPEIPPMDLATIDILRDRERGVPRYNEFRRLLHLPPITNFGQLSPEWEHRLRQVYGVAGDGSDRVDLVDLMVGMFAEKKPDGFGFSDTTFRIFVLMNSRRMKSDRFYTDDYTPAVYTQPGLDWVADNTLRSVLLRHYPTLAPALDGVKNVFAPWNTLEAPAVRRGTPAAP